MVSLLTKTKGLIALQSCIIPVLSKRSFIVSTSRLIKEIHETKEGKILTLEGVRVASPREPYLFKSAESSSACPLCSSGLDVKHTDVLILSQFLRSDGCMLPRRVTGLCKKQQKRVSVMVAMAQKAGLMPNLAPAGSKKDPTKRFQWKKFNKYFDETTIKVQ